ncbi:MAG: HepT-like ribonuclease domain-containing protein [Janthinobacterium lividum]
MSKREPKLLFEDILECAEKILRYTNHLTFEQFMRDELTMDAVIRNYEVIGEAANRLPDESKAKLPNLEWHKLKGFRNRLAHEYFGIDYDLVWKTKTKLLPELISSIKNILKNY